MIGTRATIASGAYDDAFAAAPRRRGHLGGLPPVRRLRRARHDQRPAGARARAGLPGAVAAGQGRHGGARAARTTRCWPACCRSCSARTSRSCPARRRRRRTSSGVLMTADLAREPDDPPHRAARVPRDRRPRAVPPPRPPVPRPGDRRRHRARRRHPRRPSGEARYSVARVIGALALATLVATGVLAVVRAGAHRPEPGTRAGARLAVWAVVALLAVQAVVGAVRAFGVTLPEQSTFLIYLVVSVCVLPIATNFAYAEPTRWGGAVVAAGAIAMFVAVLRLQMLWAAGPELAAPGDGDRCRAGARRRLRDLRPLRDGPRRRADRGEVLPGAAGLPALRARRGRLHPRDGRAGGHPAVGAPARLDRGQRSS